jgi:predicted DNA-binding transcriptional regulator AlpA
MVGFGIDTNEPGAIWKAYVLSWKLMTYKPTKRLLNVQEAADYLGISAKTIYNQSGPRAKKCFPVKAKRVGKLVKFDIRDLDAYIDKL